MGHALVHVIITHSTEVSIWRYGPPADQMQTRNSRQTHSRYVDAPVELLVQVVSSPLSCALRFVKPAGRAAGCRRRCGADLQLRRPPALFGTRSVSSSDAAGGKAQVSQHSTSSAQHAQHARQC